MILLLSYLKRAVKTTLGYSFASIVSRALSFVFLPYFLSRLSLAEVGIWDWYQTWFSLGVFVLSAGAAAAMTRFAILHKDNLLNQKQAIGNAFLFALVNGLIACFIGYFLIMFNVVSFNEEYALLTLINAIFFVFFSMIIAYFCMKEQMGLYALAFIGQSVGAVILTIVGVYYDYGIKSFFYANTISLLPFLFWFFIILKKHFCWNWQLGKDQIFFAGPLVIHGLLYTLILNLDRWFIHQEGGFADLGKYGLLGRFGSIFQILTLAMSNSLPIICFNAQKEDEGEKIIAPLITYFCFALISFCIISIVVTCLTIGCFLPLHCQDVIDIVPIFFSALGILSVAQLFNSGFGLSKNTTLMPLIMFITLLFHFGLLSLVGGYGIKAVCFGNLITFSLYAALNYIFSFRSYNGKMIDRAKISLLLGSFFLYATAFYLYFHFKLEWPYLFFLLISWPLSIFILGIFSEELVRAKAYIKNYWEIFINKKEVV